MDDFFQITEYQRKIYEMMQDKNLKSVMPIYTRKAGMNTVKDMLDGKYHIGYDFAVSLNWWQKCLVWLGFKNRWTDLSCMVICKKKPGGFEVVDIKHNI